MRNRFVPLIVSLLIAVVLVFIVDDFIHQVIVDPLLYVVWFITVFISSLPQQVFWGVFILIALVIAIKSMTREETTRHQAQRPIVTQRGPVATWYSRLEQAKTQEFSRWRLAQALRKVTWDTLFPDQPLNHLQPEGQRGVAASDLPPEIQAYFEAPMPSSQRFSWLWRWRQSGPHSSALNLNPETVVKYLENELDPLLGD